ncbi:hypothetical protein ACJRO7_019368 [Eucalyptus globulus]|uniref:Uncharacterized protein n=1 Tax=Eucalyptus globulus TaxID=34317 RepID=A0ABD3KD67_EUCGL
MDNKSPPCKEVADELTRESLIAISYLEPDNPINMNVQPKSCIVANDDAVTDGENTEKYRSELMSISELPPPNTSPVAVDP